MEKTLDLRVQKTRTSLVRAFRELLSKKSFEKITVQEICELAMVRRATFYKHFADKYELFSFMMREIITDYYAKRTKLFEDDRAVFYSGIIEDAFNFIEENERMIRSMINSEVLPVLLEVLSNQVVLVLEENLNKDASNGIQLLAPPKITAEAFTGALISIAKWWILNKKKSEASKDELVGYSMTLFRRLMMK